MLEQLKDDLKQAMRDRDKVRLGTIRMVMAEIQKAQIEKRGELVEDELLGLLTREVKKRRESAEAFRKGERLELAEQEEAEVAIIEGYLPSPLTDDEVRALVVAAIEVVKPESQRDMGKVMGHIMSDIRGRYDGKAASAIVRELMAKALG